MPRRGLDRPHSMLHTAPIATPLVPRARRGALNGNNRAFRGRQIAGFFQRVKRGNRIASGISGIGSRGGQQSSLTIDTPICQGDGAGGGRPLWPLCVKPHVRPERVDADTGQAYDASSGVMTER